MLSLSLGLKVNKITNVKTLFTAKERSNSIPGTLRHGSKTILKDSPSIRSKQIPKCLMKTLLISKKLITEDYDTQYFGIIISSPASRASPTMIPFAAFNDSTETLCFQAKLQRVSPFLMVIRLPSIRFLASTPFS